MIGDKAGTSSAIPGMPFRDVKVADWFYPHVLDAYRADLMRGTAAERFAPAQPLTYAQALQLVYNLRRDKTVPAVPEGSPWYAPALKWAEENGVMLPEDGAFDPDIFIPRQMFALYLNRFAKQNPQRPAEEILAEFADRESVTELCMNAMAWAVENGVMGGYQGNLMPASSLTRAQAAVMLLQYTKL